MLKQNQLRLAMKIWNLTFVGFHILICSCNSQVDKNYKKFTLKGEINGMDTGKVLIQYVLNDTYIRDTGTIKNGKFIFAGKLTEPSIATLNGGDDLNRVSVYLEPRKMKILLSKDKFADFKMSGSKTQNAFNYIHKMENPFYEKISILRDKKNKINDSIKKSKNDSNILSLKKEVDKLDERCSQILKIIHSIQIKFVLENPKSFASVVQLFTLESNEVITLDSAKSIFNGLDNSLKNTIYGKQIIEHIRKKENILTGSLAPDFKATDLNQQTVTLSQFMGKSVVLLDFWASWCLPCRESIPHLKKVYEKYHSKGFEVIAVSTDFNRKQWVDAVNQDSTNMWYHVPIAEKYAEGLSQISKDDIYQNYFVSSIPVQILIDKNGKIIGHLKDASKENEQALDQLLSQVFGY